jgi:hypothetical protein
MGSSLRDDSLQETPAAGGLKWIYKDLLERLLKADIASSAENLDLALNDAEEVEVPLLGRIYLVSREGVRRTDGQEVAEATGSVLIHYILNGSRSRPAGRFVTFAELAGPLFKQGSYATDALERPLIKRFRGRVPELLAAAWSIGDHRGGEAGMGSVSLLFNLLPHLPFQLVFYDRDEEFPARATLLCDFNATKIIEFEVLAVMVTIFVQTLTKY